MSEPVRVLLLGCVKLKHDHVLPARDLYRSPLWVGRRSYADSSGDSWHILSAQHGLVDPDEPLAPYDLALADLPARERRRWGERVIGALLERYGAFDGMLFELHAGAVYRESIEAGLVTFGARVACPLERLPLGAQLAWYRSDVQRSALTVTPTVRRRSCTAPEIAGALAALDESPARVAAADWPGTLANLDRPGLYAWWVDATGAADLAGGLKHPLRSGRIYAGQTGATRWPSGTTGKATLASRIGANHLRGRISGSTFRLTLARCLAAPLRLRYTDRKHLDAESENRLSGWMRGHLDVAVHPFLNPDPLGDLEHHVLSQLDPPLNLDGMPTTPVRLALSRLRTPR